MDLLHDTRAALGRLGAVLVIAVVPNGAEEAIEEVTVGRVDFHAVKTGLPQAHGCIDDKLAFLDELVVRETVGREALGRRGGKVLDFERRGADGPAAPLHGSERAAVMELTDHAGNRTDADARQARRGPR